MEKNEQADKKRWSMVRIKSDDLARVREIAEAREESLSAALHYLVEKHADRWLTPKSMRYLQELAKKSESIHCDQCHLKDVLNKVIDDHRRSKYFEELNESYRKLQEDPEAFKAHQEENAFYDALAGDGLENEPPYFSPQSPAQSS